MNSIKNIKKEPMVVMNFTCPIGLREKLREHSIETKIGMATIIRKGIEEQITKNIPEKICEAEEWEEEDEECEEGDEDKEWDDKKWDEWEEDDKYKEWDDKKWDEWEELVKLNTDKECEEGDDDE